MFGALQVTPSWLGTFGTIGKKGEYEISAIQQSLLNSIPWIGKIVGVIVAEPINEKFGYKTSMVIASTIQVIGVIVESEQRETETAPPPTKKKKKTWSGGGTDMLTHCQLVVGRNWGVFCAGRTIVYGAVGCKWFSSVHWLLRLEVLALINPARH